MNALVDFNLVVPAEAVQLAHVGEFLQSAVRLRGVPEQLALEANLRHNLFGALADRNLLARAHIDMAVAHLDDAVRILGRSVIRVLEIHVQQHVHAGIGHLLAPQELAHRPPRAPQRHALRANAEASQLFQYSLLGGRAVHALHRAQVKVAAHRLPVALVEAFGKINLADHSRQHVRIFKMEIIVRPVEVRRHHGNIVSAILQIETLAHLQPRNLRNGIRLVGIFERRGEQAVLRHRLRRFAGIDAGRAEKQKFLHAVAETLADDVLLDLQILIDKVRAVLQVSHNAAHVSRSQHHRFGAFLVEEALHGCGVQQIQFAVAAPHEVAVTPLFQVVPNGRADKAVVARHENLCIFFQHRNYLPLISRYPFPDIPQD